MAETDTENGKRRDASLSDLQLKRKKQSKLDQAPQLIFLLRSLTLSVTTRRAFGKLRQIIFDGLDTGIFSWWKISRIVL